MRYFICKATPLAVLCGILWIQPVLAQIGPHNGDSDLSARLVETAMLIQAREQEVLDSETRLDEMKLRHRSQLARFDGQRGELSQMLAAMQRLGRQPPALLLIRSDSAIDHVRGATLVGAVIKGIEKDANILRKELAEIDDLETIMTDERQQHLSRLDELREEQKSLTGLLTEQKGQQTALIETAKAEEGALAALAKGARDTGDLLARLEKNQAAGTKSGGLPRQRPLIQAPAMKADEQSAEDAALLVPEQSAVPEITRPARFSAAQGLLVMPARGKIVANFGARDSSGGKRRGISIRTRESAEVVAPFNGKIVFAGPFRAYGQLVILEAGEGYHILLSGLSIVHGVAGQTMAQRQPVGRMGTGPKSEATGPSESGAGSDLRDLYVEFRKDGKPFDPMPWLETNEKKVSG